jgi:hypothetical protein
MNTDIPIIQPIAQPAEPLASKVSVAQYLIARFKAVGEWILHELLTKDEPKVVQRVDAEGNVYWEIHDPSSGYIAYCSTEADVMVWLEKHYY